MAVATFAIALSLYGTTLESVPLGPEPSVPDATVTKTMAVLSEGTVVRPSRLDDLDGQLPAGTTVLIKADGRTWRFGPEREPGYSPTTIRRTLVHRPTGAVPGLVRVSV